MCAINGFNFKDKALVERMNKLNSHRGPDGTGVFFDENLSLGHNLLAITDIPKNLHQPFLSDDKNLVLLYNGEVYNYLELKKDLIDKGLNFKTEGDTEVVLRGLEYYGASFLEKLEGMFAIALYNKREKTILLVRDSDGMKPLYYYLENGKFIFSSEIKGILEHGVGSVLDMETAPLYFSLGYVPGPKTLFKGIKKLEPGEIITFNNEERRIISHNWIKVERKSSIIEFDPKKLRELIAKSVKNHTMGLRPFGLYLSGGLDSTIILHELVKQTPDLIKTFSTRFETKESRFNQDADLAKRLSGNYNIKHREILITEKDFIGAVNEVSKVLEEPRYNPSTAAYWLLAREAREDVVVVLNGSGGDELFLGYTRYLVSRVISDRFIKYPNWLVNAGYTAKATMERQIRIGKFLKLNNPSVLWVYLNQILPTFSNPMFSFGKNFDLISSAKYLSDTDNPLIRRAMVDKDMENAVSDLDKNFWLSDEEFLRSDKILMNFGLEGRFPFLASPITSYARGISSQDKLSHGLKSLMRDAYKDLLPNYIISKKKSGWNAPITDWMSSDFGKYVKEVLSPGYYSETAKLFNFKEIHNQIDSIDKFTMSNLKTFMPIFSFQLWAKNMGVLIL